MIDSKFKAIFSSPYENTAAMSEIGDIYSKENDENSFIEKEDFSNHLKKLKTEDSFSLNFGNLLEHQLPLELKSGYSNKKR